MTEVIRLAAVFLAIIVLLYRKHNLGHTMIFAAGLLGLLFGVSLPALLSAPFLAIFDPSTLNLLLALYLICILEHLMSTNGMIERMMQALLVLVANQRLVMAILPAIIGFLPSPGGARFSAPLVDAVADANTTPDTKAFINYWYRHIWEYSFPLYPAVLLTVEITGLSLRQVVPPQLFFTLIAALAGLPAVFSDRMSDPQQPETKPGAKGAALLELSVGLLPVLLVIAGVLLAGINLNLALLATIVLLLFLHRIGPRNYRHILIASWSSKLMYMVAGVMVFNFVLEMTGAVDALPEFFSSLGIPFVAIAALLPFLVGLSTGIAHVFVVVTFPLLKTAPAFDIPLLVLAFASGFGGVMLSPLHLCLPISIECLQADFRKVYRKIVLPELLLIVAAVGEYLALSHLFN